MTVLAAPVIGEVESEKVSKRVSVPRSIKLAIAAHIVVALALMPVAGHPYDLAALTGSGEAWLRWGVPLLFYWKFGFDLTVLSVGAQGLRFVLEHLGMSGAASIATAWKLPLVLSDIVVAFAFLDIGKRLGLRRPSLVPLLWLLSPVSVWVSAGHGQVEPLTVLTLVLSMNLLVRRKLVLAGIVTGLGIGFEYLPVLVVIVVGLLLAVSAIKWREALAFLGGCVVTCVVCFLPAMVSSIGRESLTSGLFSTASVAGHPGTAAGVSAVSPSVWAPLFVDPGHLWLLVAMLLGATLLMFAYRRSCSADNREKFRAAMVVCGGLLLCIVLLDPGSLPQFADLTLGGLCLVSLGVRVSPLAVICGPALQIGSAFLAVYGGSFQSYWFDMWSVTGIPGWPFPQSVQAADVLARLSVIVVVGALLLAMVNQPTALTVRFEAVTRRSAFMLGMVGLVFIGTWSAQPAFWSGVGSGGPKNLAGIGIVAAHSAQLNATGSGMTASFDPMLGKIAATTASDGALVVTGTVSAVYKSESAEDGQSSQVASAEVQIEQWQKDAGISSLWVSALLGDQSWTTASAAEKEPTVLSVNACTVHSDHEELVTPGWAIVTYDVPSTCVGQDGSVVLRPRPANAMTGGSLLWNGSGNGRWIVVYPHRGIASVEVAGQRYNASFMVTADHWDSGGLGNVTLTVRGVPLAAKQNVLSNIGVLNVDIQSVTLKWWPVDSPLDHRTGPVQLIGFGLIDAVVLIGGGYLICRKLWQLRDADGDEI